MVLRRPPAPLLFVPSTRVSVQVGDTVGDYEIVGLLGAGGMGTVYRVRNTLSDRIEALKVLLPDLSTSPDLAERFLREIKIQARLTHPNIAGLHTALRVNNQLLMVMEFVEGASLDHLMRQRAPLPLAQAVNYVSQVAGALAYAHAHGVIHRDIKPANIMITPDGVAKLMDFGIAAAARDPRMTRTGVALGSLLYMPPEQITGGTSDARSDLYSLGITFYQAVTGQRAIDADSDYLMMHKHLTYVPETASKVNPQVTPEIAELIDRLLAKDPDQRIQSAAELRGMLMSWLATNGQHNSADVTVPMAVPLNTPRSGPTGSTPVGTTTTTPPPTAPTPTPTSTTVSRFDPATLERIRREYAPFIGPLAKVLVDRAAKKCESIGELYDKLAADIPAQKDREKFLAGKLR